MGEISHIACGYFHTIIVKDNYDVIVFGSGYYGQLGLGNDKNQ